MSATVGGQSMTAALQRVLVRPPQPGPPDAWRAYGWKGPPQISRLMEEHDVFCTRLEDAGAEVVRGTTPLPDNPDAIYVCDTTLTTDAGVMLLRPGKAGRQVETDAVERDLDAAGVEVSGRMEAPATAEGGDLVWLDERTLLAGRGYRTNEVGIETVAEALPDVEVMRFDLPHLRGSGEVLHLMSLMSLLDDDLAVVYLPLVPVRLVQLLREREFELIEVPDEEFETMGPNVLALAPRVALALDGNPDTARRMEKAGVDVRPYLGNEISFKGDGGPTCLTRPLLRRA